MVLIAAAEQAGELSNARFWGAVGLASAIATALATAASSITAIWWRIQDRTDAEWSVRVVDRGGMTDMGSRAAAPKVGVVIQNIGDGDAYQVAISGKFLTDARTGQEGWYPKGRPEVHQPIPVLRTSDSVHVSVTAESFEVWDRAAVEISWWPPPTRKKKEWLVRSRQRRQWFPLREVTPAPTDLPAAPEGEKVY